MERQKKGLRKVLSLLLIMCLSFSVVMTDVLPAYAGFTCQDCGEYIDDSTFCQMCYRCDSCIDMCRCGDVCIECHKTIGEGASLEYTPCEGCDECKADGTSFCQICGICDNCEEICSRCDKVCIPCHESLEDAADEYIPCPSCMQCKEGVRYCEFCDYCEDCIDLCEACGENVCTDCHDSLSGGGETSPCPECGFCKEDGREYCPECGVCEDCESLCEDCGYCLNCVGDIDIHCPNCDNCLESVDLCADGGAHCIECCDNEGYLCEECGVCLEATGMEVCDICGYCVECCKYEVEELGCSCEDLCWTEIDDEHFCADCGVCLSDEGCNTCSQAGENRCTECCESLSQMAGCDCKETVCVNDAEWTEHLKAYHDDALTEHNPLPSTQWSMDSQYHWHECRWCEASGHVVGRAKHSLDDNGICTTCKFSSRGGIVIVQQPKDRYGLTSYNGWAWSEGCKADTTELNENTVSFRVLAYGANGTKGLTYQWYRREVYPGGSYASMLNDDEDEYKVGTKTNVLTTYVPYDACCEGVEYYYYCVIKDANGNQVISDEARLYGKHNYILNYKSVSTYDGSGVVHRMDCAGDGCGKYIYEEHSFGQWKWWSDADGVQKRRWRSCSVCKTQQTVAAHEHDSAWNHFYEAGDTLIVVKEDDTNKIYEYKFNYEDKWVTVGTSRGFHWADCVDKNCTLQIKEEHDWGPWKVVVPATKKSKGGLYRTCNTCEMDQTWAKIYYSWHTHPVNVTDGFANVDIAEEGTTVTVTASKIQGKVPTSGTARIDATITTYNDLLHQTQTQNKTLEISFDISKTNNLTGRFTVPTSGLVISGKNEILTELGANVIDVTFNYEDCSHPSSVVINTLEATCLGDGYTGDTVCEYCNYVIEEGLFTAPTGHGEAVKVQENVYVTDWQGNVKTDKNGYPLYVLRKEEAIYCDGNARGSYTGDEVCEDCGELLNKGKYKPYQHYYTLLNDMSAAEREFFEDVYGLRAAKDPKFNEAGYSGDRVCDKCGEVEYGHETWSKTITAVKVENVKIPSYGDVIDKDVIQLPDTVKLIEYRWWDTKSNRYLEDGDKLDFAFSPANLKLQMVIEPKDGYMFRDYIFTNENMSVVNITVNGNRISDVHGVSQTDGENYGRLYVTVSTGDLGFHQGTVYGTITSNDVLAGPITVELQKTEGVTDYMQILDENVASYEVKGVEPGTYTMIVTKKGYYSYKEIVVVGGDSLEINVNLEQIPPAKIVTQPVSVSVFSGETAKVTVKATGDGLTYKWYFKNKGASKFSYTSSFTGESYSIKMSADRAGRQVYCVVTDQYGNSVTSNTVTLGMKNKATITTQPKSVSVYSGEVAKVTVKATGDGLTYKWYFKNKGASKFSYTSSFTGNSYSVKMSADRAGRQVYCVVTDQYGNSVTSNTVTLGMKNKATITTQPKSVSVYSGQTAKMTVKATGDGLTYKWQIKTSSSASWINTTTSGYKTNTITISATKARNGYQYRCVVTDKYGNKATSSAAKLTVK